jgi:dihydroorotate dehydrogenase
MFLVGCRGILRDSVDEQTSAKSPARPATREPPVIGFFDRLSRPLMRALDPEDAHALAVKALRFMPLPRTAPDAPELAVRAFGLNFPNPVGLAAGFDKNAQVPDALLRLGFGFVEVGTVTPRPQAGNPRPRIFRLEADEAVINRLGFNNEGAPVVLARLAERAKEGGIVGVNVGANRDSADRTEDYVRLIENFAAVASYFTVNVSSPNTPGLRDLQQASALDDLLARVIDAREQVRARSGPVPVLLKIAPDLSLTELDDVVGIARRHRADGMIVGNTTISRPASLRTLDKASEAGGLSGRPLFKLSTRMLAETFVRAEGAFPLIGAGGVDSGPTAIAKIKAGATLVQLYSGLVFRGIGLLNEIKADLAAALKRGHRDSLGAMIGVDAAEITAESWPV